MVLLSGGLDSTVTAHLARAECEELHALTVNYGQRHAVEILAARRVARAVGVARHLELDLDLRGIGGSALTADLEVPRDRDEEAIGTGIPVTYVPARNTILLSLCLGLAEVVEADRIYLGVNALDYSGYPDCRPEFLAAFEALARVATRAGVEGRHPLRIVAPLLHMTKADIVRTGVMLGVDFSLTHSCYDPGPDGRACGRCDACRLRLKGFEEAGVVDPIGYSGPIHAKLSPPWKRRC